MLYCIFIIHMTNAHGTVLKARCNKTTKCSIMSIVINTVNRIKQKQCSKYQTISNKILLIKTVYGGY